MGKKIIELERGQEDAEWKNVLLVADLSGGLAFTESADGRNQIQPGNFVFLDDIPGFEKQGFEVRII